jgi:hypothetical protein
LDENKTFTFPDSRFDDPISMHIFAERNLQDGDSAVLCFHSLSHSGLPDFLGGYFGLCADDDSNHLFWISTANGRLRRMAVELKSRP